MFERLFIGFNLRNGFNIGLVDIEGINEPIIVNYDGLPVYVPVNGILFRFLFCELLIGFMHEPPTE